MRATSSCSGSPTSGPSPGHALIACPGSGSTCQTGYHTYTVIIDRTNTSAETLQFLMDGVVESTIIEASVGTAAWQAAIDHGFFIIWDLAMGGNYPDGIQGSTTPTAATTSGGTLSAAWVAVYEQGGNSTPTGTPTATGQVKGQGGLCLANQNSLNTEGNPYQATVGLRIEPAEPGSGLVFRTDVPAKDMRLKPIGSRSISLACCGEYRIPRPSMAALPSQKVSPATKQIFVTSTTLSPQAE